MLGAPCINHLTYLLTYRATHYTVRACGAGSVCSCKSLVDLTLVLDSSSTVRDWPAIREFAVSILDFFDVGSSRARVAVVVVGRTSSVVVRLDQYSDDRQRLYSAIRDLSQAGGPRSVLSGFFACLSASYAIRTLESAWSHWTCSPYRVQGYSPSQTTLLCPSLVRLLYCCRPRPSGIVSAALQATRLL